MLKIQEYKSNFTVFTEDQKLIENIIKAENLRCQNFPYSNYISHRSMEE